MLIRLTSVSSGLDARLDWCRGCVPVPGLLQTVQRAELWALPWLCRPIGPVIWELRIPNVVRCISRLLDHGSLSKPLPLFNDGDPIAIDQYLILAWGLIPFV